VTSLLLCTVLYIAVAAVLTGMVPYDRINIDAPVSDAFAQVGLPWVQLLVALGALAGITSVLLVMMLSQRASCCDGARRPDLAHVLRRRPPPLPHAVEVDDPDGIVVALLGGFLPLRMLAELTNIGTLLAFVIVCVAVLIMRVTHPEASGRSARRRAGDADPGIAFCLMLMMSLPVENWWRLIIWLAAGLLIYVAYGRHHSELRLRNGAREKRAFDELTNRSGTTNIDAAD